uniref:Uncharacterized protein n=1 Tax=Loxodonta africana TaxID=9785 RepID=G3U4B1_LOXAF
DASVSSCPSGEGQDKGLAEQRGHWHQILKHQQLTDQLREAPEFSLYY